MVQVSGAGKVYQQLRARSLSGKKKEQVTVGYSAPYAAKVHEDLTVHHNNGSAKYLETVYRMHEQEIARIIIYNLNNKESLETALQRAAWFVLNESKKLVPVDTGFLRDSGYIK